MGQYTLYKDTEKGGYLLYSGKKKLEDIYYQLKHLATVHGWNMGTDSVGAQTQHWQNYNRSHLIKYNE